MFISYCCTADYSKLVAFNKKYLLSQFPVARESEHNLAGCRVWQSHTTAPIKVSARVSAI